MAGRHRRAAEPQPARGRWIAIAAAVVAVVVLAVVLPLVFLGGGGDGSNAASNHPTTPPVSTTPATTTVAPTTTTATPSTSSVAPTTTKPTTRPPTHAAPPPTLVVRADRAASWLTVSDRSGHIRFNALVPRGTSEHFDGPFFHVVIGFPPGVIVTVNGKPQPRGGPGRVLRFDVRGH